jgi:2-polyprenyl-3-methyl-5-hydroxy-6-metoxy-1,4-benzoquinol methylase/outer membrane murein-binding lipoprotein Lpp
VASSKYDIVVDLSLEDNSHTMMVRLVGANKRVLDVGCANGYLARVLVENGCTVSGVEVDAAAAEQARSLLQDLVVGDLEQLDLAAELGTGRFDVVVLGDVLEHLRDPLPVLRSVRPLLAQGGYVVMSIPNVAHGAVRVSLLKGRFDYRPLGLLDTTHLRFFTRESLTALLHDAGLAPTDFLRTTAGLFETEQELRPDDVPADLVEQVMSDPDASTYQFVVRAVPDDADHLVAAMRGSFEQRLEQLGEQVAQLQAQLAQAQEDTEARRRELAAVQATKVMRSTRRVRALYGRLRAPRT